MRIEHVNVYLRFIIGGGARPSKILYLPRGEAVQTGTPIIQKMTPHTLLLLMQCLKPSCAHPVRSTGIASKSQLEDVVQLRIRGKCIT